MNLFRKKRITGVNGQEGLAVFVKDAQKVDGSGPCTAFIVSFPECLDHSVDIIPAILLTSLLERDFQRLLSLVLK